jgi:hypothetical protein
MSLSTRQFPTRRALPAIVVCAATALAGVTGGPTPAAAAAVSCVDFLSVADNTHPGVLFTRNGYTFRSPPATDPIVNVFVDLAGAPVHGLQFNTTGVRVGLPAPARSVIVTIGVFTTPAVTIRAYDAADVLVDFSLVAADNLLHTVTLSGATEITRLRFTGGGNEGVINSICS